MRSCWGILHVEGLLKVPVSIQKDFLLRRYNQRADEYGGSLENRVRFLRELIEDTKEAVGDTCAVAVRLAAVSSAN